MLIIQLTSVCYIPEYVSTTGVLLCVDLINTNAISVIKYLFLTKVYEPTNRRPQKVFTRC